MWERNGRRNCVRGWVGGGLHAGSGDVGSRSAPVASSKEAAIAGSGARAKLGAAMPSPGVIKCPAPVPSHRWSEVVSAAASACGVGQRARKRACTKSALRAAVGVALLHARGKHAPGDTSDARTRSRTAVWSRARRSTVVAMRTRSGSAIASGTKLPTCADAPPRRARLLALGARSGSRRRALQAVAVMHAVSARPAGAHSPAAARA
jgi:hypothetical protein